jgi:hypothetical protein
MGDTDIYQSMAKTARSEGFDEIAEWFECIAKTAREPIVDLTDKLEWEKLPCGDHMAPTNTGYYLITDWTGHLMVSFCDSEKDTEKSIAKERDLDVAKAAAEDHWRAA